MANGNLIQVISLVTMQYLMLVIIQLIIKCMQFSVNIFNVIY